MFVAALLLWLLWASSLCRCLAKEGRKEKREEEGSLKEVLLRGKEEEGWVEGCPLQGGYYNRRQGESFF